MSDAPGGPDPRNLWAQLALALDLAAAGDGAAARRRLADMRHHPDLGDDLARLYAAEIARRAAGRGPGPGGAAPIARIGDYLAAPPGQARPRFRRLPATAKASGLPGAMVLPRRVGAGNDAAFLLDAGEAATPGRIARLHVVVAPGPGAAETAAAAARLRVPDPAMLRVSLFAPGVVRAGVETLPHALLDPAAAPALARIAREADLVIFLSAGTRPDPDLPARLLPLAEVSDLAVQPLVEAQAGATLFARGPHAAAVAGASPHRELRGLDLAVPAALLRRAGPPDPRFATHRSAAREFGFRLWNAGAYFIPAAVPEIATVEEADAAGRDAALATALCPDPDRPFGGRFEVPKVSLCLPASASRQAVRRIVEAMAGRADLELCLLLDAAAGEVAGGLARDIGGAARLRCATGRGMAEALNRAAEGARAAYLLWPGPGQAIGADALRAAVDMLDADPALAGVAPFGGSRAALMAAPVADAPILFRRRDWARAGGLRADAGAGAGAVDDLALRLAEAGRIAPGLGAAAGAPAPVAAARRARREALDRQGLGRDWEVDVTGGAAAYARCRARDLVVFWPDYSTLNPYLRLLYAPAMARLDVLAGPIAAAHRALDAVAPPARVTFHLHWLSFLFRDCTNAAAAAEAADAFLGALDGFAAQGGRIVWTLHNVLSHDTAFPEIEADLHRRVADLADVIHLHSAASLPEVRPLIGAAAAKVRISRHGHYIGAYPDRIDAATARRQLGLAETDDVMLFTGLVRPYKGIDTLLAAFETLLTERPRLQLVIAGTAKGGAGARDEAGAPEAALGAAARARLQRHDRYVEAEEMQVFFRAADVAVYPYRRILTSGSMMLALGFGTPAVVPDVGMTREVLAGTAAGRVYDAQGGAAALAAALGAHFAAKDAGRAGAMRAAARATALRHPWPDPAALF